MKIETFNPFSSGAAPSVVTNLNDRQLVIAGIWDDSPDHSGYIEYYLSQLDELWILEAFERNTILGDVTPDDVASGNLSDSQVQAVWGMSLEDAQNTVDHYVVAVCRNAAEPAAEARHIAMAMYTALDLYQHKLVNERNDKTGLLDDEVN